MSDHGDLIARFTSVTGEDPERAQFYLEAAAWNIDIAIASFFDHDEGDQAEAPPAMTDPAPPPQPKRSVPPPAASSRFATIDNLSKKDAESDSSDEEGEAFYTGGSERGGGQQVLGPPRKNPKRLIREMFESAKEHGAESVEPGSAAADKGGASTFKGNAYKLGHTEGDSEMVEAPPKMFEPKEMDVVLKLWQNGFSIDDGPLRAYQDPQNQEFLASIKKGEVPRELVRIAKGGEVNVNMEDHRGEEFNQSAAKAKPFEGEGHRLGSPADPMAGVGVIGAAASGSSGKSDENSAKSAVAVDENAPTTNLQLRLADGSRMVAKFNHTHTVADIRNYIVTARPQYVTATFVLLTTFPNKELTDSAVTLKDANLLNAVIVQRIR